MAIREGRWDCPSCGSTRVYGRHVDCPGCGKPRPAGIRFYLADGEPAITDPEQLREATAGPDWICLHCAASNRATQASCGGCGAPRGSSPTQPVIEYRAGAAPPLVAAAGGVGATGGAAGGVEAAGGATAVPAKAIPRNHRRASRNILLGIAAVCLLPVAIVAGITLGQEREEEVLPAVVENLWWERAITIPFVEFSDGEGWTVPDSAEILAREQRVRRTERVVLRVDTTWRTVPVWEQVLERVDTVERTVSEEVRTGTEIRVCGSRDLGNGYFEDVECREPVYETRTRTETDIIPRYRQVQAGTERRMDLDVVHGRVPVYGTWFRYRTRAWTTREVTRQGTLDSVPAWPELPSDTLREVRRRESFWMELRDNRGSNHQKYVPDEAWPPKYVPGQRIALRLRHDYGYDVMPRDSLPACRRWHAGETGPPPDTLGCTTLAERPRP
jgi:hypothetical protein